MSGPYWVRRINRYRKRFRWHLQAQVADGFGSLTEHGGINWREHDIDDYGDRFEFYEGRHPIGNVCQICQARVDKRMKADISQ